jgi:hypothetical protein
MVTPSSGDIALVAQVAIGLVERPIASGVRQCASSCFRQGPDDTLMGFITLEKNVQRIPWTLESVFN